MVGRTSRKKAEQMNDPSAWAKQLDIVYGGGRAVCPVCGNMETEHSFSVFEDGVGFGDFYCRKCGAGTHLSRMKFPEGIKIELKEL